MAEQRGFGWRFFTLLMLGFSASTVGLFAYRASDETLPARPDYDQRGSPPKSAQEVREEAWKRIQPALAAADKETQALTNQLIQTIETFFDERKQGANSFAEAALGWRSKWKLVTSRQGHRDFLTERFSEYIFSREDIDKLLTNATAEYELGLKSVENRLLVSIRADLSDLPSSALPAFANERIMQERFDRIFSGVVSGVAKDFSINVGGSLVVGGIVTAAITSSLQAVATRLGVSATIIGSGAASTWATLGAGLVIAIGVDYVLDWIIGWFYDPVGNIAAKVSGSLEDMKNCITSGHPEAWSVRDRLAEMAKNDPDPSIQAQAADAVNRIEGGGALGLRHVLGRVAEVYRRSHEQTLHQLVFGDAK